MLASEIFAEGLVETLVRYGLYFGAAFQIICLIACVTLVDDSTDYYNIYYDKVLSDSDECSSEQSSPGHRTLFIGKIRKQDKKKRR